MAGTETTEGHDTLCGAAKRGGGACGRPAGWGTPHPGVGRCKNHGGCTPTQVKAARTEEARRAVVQFGLPVDVEPHEALREELHRAAGWVAWLEQRVRSEGEDALATTAFTDNGAFTVTSPYYELLTAERKQLAAVAQACIKAGVEERQVRVIEQAASFAAAAIRDVLGRLGHDLADTRVAEAVRASLSTIDGGTAQLETELLPEPTYDLSKLSADELRAYWELTRKAQAEPDGPSLAVVS